VKGWTDLLEGTQTIVAGHEVGNSMFLRVQFSGTCKTNNKPVGITWVLDATTVNARLSAFRVVGDWGTLFEVCGVPSVLKQQAARDEL